MTMWDTCLIDGTDLGTLGTITDFSGLSQTAPTKQEVIDIPGRQGSVFVPGVLAAYSFPVPIVIIGDDHGDVNDQYDDLVALLDSRTTVLTVTRRRTVGASSVAETAECVQVSGLTPQWIGTRGMRVELMFQNLSGDWTPVAGS